MSTVNLQPELQGETLLLRPLQAEDFEALYRAASDPDIWAMHPDSQRYQRDVFKPRFFDGAIASGGALAIVDKTSGAIIGSSRYYEWRPELREISIGYTFIEKAYWGNGTNSELKQLMLEHIYQWADTVWLHVGADNLRSRRATEKLGASLAYEEQRELDGKPFTQLYYRLAAKDYVGN